MLGKRLGATETAGLASPGGHDFQRERSSGAGRGGRDDGGAAVRDGKQAWGQLRTDPDYVADWRARGAEPVVEAAPFPLRRQTVADLEAGRWNLLVLGIVFASARLPSIASRPREASFAVV